MIPNSNIETKAKTILTLLLMAGSSCLLLAIRMYITTQFTYLFMVWNLFLALIPLWTAFRCYKFHSRYPGRYFLIGSMVLFWLLFFPNAPYLITDFIHLHEREHRLIPLWFDVMLLFSFSITGLLSGLISLYFIHEILKKILSNQLGWISIALISLLTGYGIFLGRVQRWNSWDLFFNTRALLTDSVLQLANPIAIAMTLIFATLVMVTYLMLLNFIEMNASAHDLQNH